VSTIGISYPRSRWPKQKVSKRGGGDAHLPVRPGDVRVKTVPFSAQNYGEDICTERESGEVSEKGVQSTEYTIVRDKRRKMRGEPRGSPPRKGHKVAPVGWVTREVKCVRLRGGMRSDRAGHGNHETETP